jgi:hypothetical protein
MSDWLITNKDHIEKNGLELFCKKKQFKLYHKGSGIDSFNINGDKVTILIDGYVLPRINNKNDLSGSTYSVLIKELYLKYNLDFVNYIKGNFIIIVLKGPEFHIFTDRIGIRKFFYYSKGGIFIISNRFKLLSKNTNCEVDYENLAIYSLMNHFIDGLTFVKDIFYSHPSSKIYFNGALNFDSYWKCEELLNLEINQVSYDDFAEKFIRIIKSYIDYLNPDKISLTLTGGLDSRAILVALLHLGVKPELFTYGNPYSGDVIIAKKIAKACGLNHKNYYLKPSDKWFSKLADNIIDLDNSIIHFHRAHRLFAVENPDSVEPDNEILFGGYMGGELLRSFSSDGIIVSDFTKNLLKSNLKVKQLVKNNLKRNLIKTENLNVNKIVNILLSQKYSTNDQRRNRFFATLLLLAGNHHAQDLNLFSFYKKYPIPIYLDIDFLEFIFASKFNFFYSNFSPHNYIKRIKSHELYCYLIFKLSPILAKIPLSKQGYYKPVEMIKDKSLIFFSKRFLRKYFSRQKYAINFPLGTWMGEYVGIQLEVLQNSEIMSDFINIEDLLKLFRVNDHKNYEKYWRKFTNPIFFSKLFNFYLK